jgi:iron complex transport system permease protein
MSRGAALLLLGLALGGLALLSAGLGHIRIEPLDALRVVWARLAGLLGESGAGLDPVLANVVWDVRLPRILAAVGAGAGLAVAGALFQAVLRNPLADPYTLGVSAGAACGASLAIVLGLTFAGPATVGIMAFVGALAALATVLGLATSDGRSSPESLILAGVVVAAILAAGVGFLKYMANEQTSLIVFWLMGSFVAKGWAEAGASLSAAVFGLGLAFYYGRECDILGLGGRAATTLGVETARLRLLLLAGASLTAAVCVSVAGIIGFVGLIVPHLARLLVGPDTRVLAPASALAGGALLLAADTLARAALPHEAPVGILTALLGGPYFCYLFRRRQTGRSHD